MPSAFRCFRMLTIIGLNRKIDSVDIDAPNIFAIHGPQVSGPVEAPAAISAKEHGTRASNVARGLRFPTPRAKRFLPQSPAPGAGPLATEPVQSSILELRAALHPTLNSPARSRAPVAPSQLRAWWESRVRAFQAVVDCIVSPQEDPTEKPMSLKRRVRANPRGFAVASAKKGKRGGQGRMMSG